MQKPSDEFLVAYLDGELDAASCAEIEAWLAQDPATRERLARLTESAAAVRAAFDEVLREEVPARLLAAAHGTGATAEARVAEVVPFRARRGAPQWMAGLASYRRWWVAVPVAASLLGLLIGGGAVYYGVDLKPADEKQTAVVAGAASSWLDNAAEYHKLFVLANSGGDGGFADVPAKDGGDNGEYIKKLNERTGQQNVKAPNLKPWGLVLQGARVVVIEQHPAAQYVYTADNKDVGKAIGPLTVMVALTTRQDVAPTFTHRQDENLLYWRRKGHAYAIVGQAEIGYMWGLANDIAWQLRDDAI
jgi:anti-sigma factor RsiW